MACSCFGKFFGKFFGIFFTDAFWQQRLSGWNFATWFVQKNVASCGSAFFGLAHIAAGVLMLVYMQGAFEERREYGAGTKTSEHGKVLFPESGGTEVIEIKEDVSRVALYAEIPTFLGNYRTFSTSKDPTIASARFAKISCDGATKFEHFKNGRGPKGFEALMKLDPPHPFLNMPVLKQAQENATMKMHPCGMNSYALNLDMLTLEKRDDNNASVWKEIELDETKIAWDTDIEFLQKMKSVKAGAPDPIKGVFALDGDKATKISFGKNESWINGNEDKTPAHQRDRAFLRLLSFYRTPPGHEMRLLLGHYRDLKKGIYRLRAIHVDQSWNTYPGAEKRTAVLAKLTGIGTRSSFLPILAIAVGSFQCIFALVIQIAVPLLKREDVDPTNPSETRG